MSARAEANPTWSLFDAAAQHRSIRLDCPRCRHTAIFHAAGLWLMFTDKCWNEDLRSVSGRFYCRICRTHGGPKVHPSMLLSPDPPNHELPLPTDAEWKQAISRRR